MLQEQLDPVLARRRSAASPIPSISHCPRLGVGRLERVVVALAAGPDDQVRAQRAGEVGRLADDPPRLAADPGSGLTRPPRPNRGSRCKPAGDAVDVVAAERRADLVEVVGRELVRVVELVAVDQVAEPLDGAVHLLGDRLGVVAVLAAGSRRARTA